MAQDRQLSTKIICSILLSLFCCIEMAYAQWQSFSLGLGNLTEQVGKVQTNVEGDTNKFEFKPFLTGGLNYQITPEWLITPGALITFPQNGRDKNIKKFTTAMWLGPTYNLNPLFIRGGAGIIMNTIMASGGTEDLGNGDQITSFPIPNGVETSRNVYYYLGADLSFIENWMLRLDMAVTSLFETEARAFNYSLAVIWNIPFEQGGRR